MIQTANFVLVVTELVPMPLEARNIHFLMKSLLQEPKNLPKRDKNGAETTSGGLSDGTQGEKRSPESILRSLSSPQVELYTFGGGKICNFL